MTFALAGLNWARAAPTMTASFLASIVEFVEALTIILAVGTVRGWRHALAGTGLALAVLVGIVSALGPALARIPIDIVQIGVGTLLLLFGLRWLRKAILRSAGVIALHDESAAFTMKTEALRGADAHLGGWDRLAIATAFQITMLEGIEVVFIVIAVGASRGMLVPAAVAAAGALLFVVLLGLILHQPLARIPENLLKFAVGVLLSAFGTFWVGEGIGIVWPGSDWSIPALVASYLVIAVAAVAWARRLANRPTTVAATVDRRTTGEQR